MFARLRSLVLVSFLSTSYLIVGQSITPALAAFPSTGDAIFNWEPAFMANDWTVTRTQALAEARTFDVIVGLRYTYRDHVAAMKAANPDLRILVYLNGGFSMNDDGTAFPNGWYARDRYGRKIKSVQFGNYLMDVSDPGWIDSVADRCQEFLAFSGYDGCLLDSLGPAALDPTYVTSLPINPATGLVWKRADYLKATSALALAAKRRIGWKLLVPNGVTWGQDYFDPAGPTKILTAGVDGGMVELFIRPPFVSLSQYRSVSQWKADVNMLVDAGASGRTLLVVTKAWASGTAAQKDRWHRYALGTFLLGTNGRSYFSFLSDRNTAKPSSYWSVQLGSPVTTYALIGGVYQRTFANGKVLVNPSTSTYTVSLGRRYETLGGQIVTSVTLGAHSAAILTEA
jgi:hypothetical protein